MLAAVLLLVVGGFLALAINVGHKMNAKAQLQAAFDAAAIAGAHELDGTAAGLSATQTTAVAIGTRHALDRVAVGLATTDVIPGYWDKVNRRFYSAGQTVTIGGTSVTLSSSSTSPYFNAVKVFATTDGSGSHNSPLDVWFGAFLGGPSTLRVAASAIAVGGGPCTDDGCTLPMAIPSCALMDGAGNVACGTVMRFYFNHGHGKDIALADVDQPSHSVNNSEVRQQMADGAACSNPDVEVGDSISLGNGNDFNSQVEDRMHSPTNIVCAAAAPYTGCLRRQIAVVNIGTNCSVPMNGPVTIVGFVRVVITRTQVNPGNQRSIDAYIDCTGSASSSVSSGCASFGFGTLKQRLVQ